MAHVQLLGGLLPVKGLLSVLMLYWALTTLNPIAANAQTNTNHTKTEAQEPPAKNTTIQVPFGMFYKHYPRSDKADLRKPLTVRVFRSNLVYNGKASAAEPFILRDDKAIEVKHTDTGRHISRMMTIEPPKVDDTSDVQITAIFKVEPIPRQANIADQKATQEPSDITMYDRWDKAGYLRLHKSGYPPVELIKFITSFGHANEHRMDLSHLAALLHGECTFEGHVDTWGMPGFRLSFRLEYEVKPKDTLTNRPADWIMPLMNEQNISYVRLYGKATNKRRYFTYVHQNFVVVPFVLPEKMKDVYMYYYTSGHGHNKVNAGEFKSRINVAYLNSFRVMQYAPWRVDGYKYRNINPQSGQVTYKRYKQVWSSDFPRSGWMPGNQVKPKIIELTTNMFVKNPNYMRFTVEGINTLKNTANGETWRISGYLAGHY